MSKVCNIEGAVKYLENLNITLDVNKKSKNPALALKNLVTDIGNQRSAIVNASAYSGSGMLNIQEAPYNVLLKTVNKETVQELEESTLENIAEFTIGKQKDNVLVSQLLDVLNEISQRADTARGVVSTQSTKKYLNSLSNVIKQYSGNKTVSVLLVNQIPKKGTDKQPLSTYDSTTNTITVSMSIDAAKANNSSLTVSSAKIIMNDVVKSITSDNLSKNKKINDEITKLREYAIKSYTSLNKSAPRYEQGSATYGFLNNEEFVAEVVTNYELTKLLSGMKPAVARNLYTRVKNAFKKLISKVKKDAGIDEKTYTLLDESLEAIEAVIENDVLLLPQERDAASVLAGKTNVANESQNTAVDKEGYKFKVKEQEFTTNTGQTTAIDSIKDWYGDKSKPNFLLQGRGGTGKTTVINVALDLLNVNPKNVMFATPTHKATKVIREANQSNKYSESTYSTIASILGLKPGSKDGEFVQAWPYKFKRLPSVLVVDEGSMLNYDMYYQLKSHALSQGTRIIFMGDNAQLPPPNDPKSPVKSVLFTDNAYATVYLNELMRQDKDSPIILATDEIINSVNEIEKILEEKGTKFYKNKKAEEALTSLKFDGNIFNNTYNSVTGEGVLVTDSNFDAVLPHLVADLKNDPLSTKYIHLNNYTNLKTIEQNLKIRKALYGDRAVLEEFIVGEPLVLNTPYSIDVGTDEDLVLDNAEEFTLVSNKRVEKYVDYVLNKGRKTERRLTTEEKMDVYELTVRSSIRDETFVIDKPVMGTNTKQVLIDYFTDIEMSKGKAKGLLKNNDGRFLIEKELKSVLGFGLSHAYILNNHKAQGSSYNSVYLNAGNVLGTYGPDANNKVKGIYVGASRPKKRLVIIDSRNSKSSSVVNGRDMNRVPVVDYTFSDINTAETDNINDEVNKCRGGL